MKSLDFREMSSVNLNIRPLASAPPTTVNVVHSTGQRMVCLHLTLPVDMDTASHLANGTQDRGNAFVASGNVPLNSLKDNFRTIPTPAQWPLPEAPGKETSEDLGD